MTTVDVATLAACGAGIHPDAFYADKDDADSLARAKAVCGGCPVREACLRSAFAAGETEGIWGGLTPEERAQLNQTRPCRDCSTPIPRSNATLCADCRVGSRLRRQARYDTANREKRAKYDVLRRAAAKAERLAA